ncbi:hypothetical protein RHPLAN_29070 [Rhodoplanes sp. Z2-YC6860]|nr:hypothetical protein RHPLAN_29070 [Rhodoplanes sp. Z2-YC6860]
MWLAACGAAVAQTGDEDSAVQAVYASIENSIHREYDAVLGVVSRKESESPTGRFEKMRDVVRTMYYNKAAVFSNCAAEAEQYRAPGAPRVPASQNLLLNTCLEEKLGELNKFSNMLGYATTFFPDRIERCGEASRLHDREKLLPPYGFLQIAEPKLYDFARYTTCLMKSEATSPAAR